MLLLNKKDKRDLFLLILFSIMISLIETLGVSVIMPFISVASDFELIHNNKYYSMAYEFFSFDSEVKFIIIFGLFLIGFYFFRSLINITYFYFLSNFTQGRYHILAYKLFENYMGLPYKEFTKRNSSTLTKSIVNEAMNLTAMISSILLMISESFILIFIYGLMLYVNYKITLLLSLLLILNALFMIKTISKKIKKAGVKRTALYKMFFEIVNKSFSNFKLIKLSGNSNKVLDEFETTSHGFSKANAMNITLSNVPRLFLEAIGFSLILIIIIYIVFVDQNDISMYLPTISMFVIALYRLLPSVNRIMTSYNQIMFVHKSLDIIHEDLIYNNEQLGDKKISYSKMINLSNISFEYEENKPVLKNINLQIKKGSKVAFIGESGGGKSTLVDLIIGLYKPQKGKIEIDDEELSDITVKNWRMKIGYIPQSVYLFDGTVAENIAFGNPIEIEKIIKVLKQANIYDFIQQKDGLETKVGEGGIMFSGGQKQRIAIARALYNNPEVLVLDEATSALDQNIEEKIMEEIYKISEDKTLIIIAHRLSTIQNCDVIYKIKNGNIINE